MKVPIQDMNTIAETLASNNKHKKNAILHIDSPKQHTIDIEDYTLGRQKDVNKIQNRNVSPEEVSEAIKAFKPYR